MGVVYCQGYYIGEPQDKIKEENNEWF
jgi:EAL domain-containing protein (putative c-di-GMP-specific phosphodiesterase class I)